MLRMGVKSRHMWILEYCGAVRGAMMVLMRVLPTASGSILRIPFPMSVFVALVMKLHRDQWNVSNMKVAVIWGMTATFLM
jgi:hypothetical protein